MLSFSSSAMECKKGRVFKDIMWYATGTAVPMIIAFIKTPVFTRYFTPEEYGYLSIVNTTFNYITVAVYSWLSSCIWRYYNYYKNSGRLSFLYSNILFLYLIATVVITVISFAWIAFLGRDFINRLVLLIYLQTILQQLISMYLVITRMEGKAFKYNIITVFSSAAGFALLCILTFAAGMRIEAVVMSMVIIYTIVLFYILAADSCRNYFKKTSISAKAIVNFLKYGSSTLISALCLVILTSSDRYIIALFSGMGPAGIYNQIYTIGQLSIVALISVFMNAVNPELFRELETNFIGYKSMLYRYTNMYIRYLLPFVVYFSLFSRQVSDILLGSEFREGYGMMPYIMFSAFIYGMSEFIQDILRFANKLKTLVAGFILACSANIILNLALVPVFGYQIAAATTMVSYVALYLFAYFRDNTKYFHNKQNLQLIFPCILLLAIQVLVDSLLRGPMGVKLNVPYTILEGVVFAAVYYGTLERKKIRLLLLR